MGSHAPSAGTATSPCSSSSCAASSSNESHRAQAVLLLPFRSALHGHNTSAMLLQLGRRHSLVHHGLRPTLVTTRYIVLHTAPVLPSPLVAAISDGFNDAGHA